MRKFFGAILVASAVLTACIKQETQVPDDINQADRDFIFHASFANAGELAISRLADTVSADSIISSFAAAQVQSHTSITSDFTAVAAGFVFYTKDSLDTRHLHLQEQLLALSGRSFDSVYIHSRVKEQDSLVIFFRREIENGINPRLRNFAVNTVPVLEKQKQRADSIAALY